MEARDAMVETLIQLAREDERLVVLDADVSKSTRTRLLGKAFPGRFFNVGISEMHMASMAAGMAASGLKPWIFSFAVFVALRALEPIRTMIAYPKANVKVVGGYAGLTAMQHGPTHQCLNDIAVMRALPGMTVLSVTDNRACEELTRAAHAHMGPVYLSTGYVQQADAFDANARIGIGGVYSLREGKDVLILASGLTTRRALDAATLLEARGVGAQICACPTIKPLPKEALLALMEGHSHMLVTEEHLSEGGLFEAVAALAAVSGLPIRVGHCGPEDTFAQSAPYAQLVERYGLSAQGIARMVEALLKK